MSDIDFDELDRAVNSLISNAPSPETSSPVAEPVLAPTQEPSVAEPIVISQPVLAPAPIAAPAAPAGGQPTINASLAGQRSSGRFMDVIHPSADMRSNPAAPNVQRPNLTPMTPTMSMQSVAPAAQNNMVSFEEPKPLESPFIAGAKVEKRPLGAFSGQAEPAPVELSPSGEVIEKPVDAPEPPTNEEGFSSVLPEELQSDLLKIESGNVATPEVVTEPEKPAFEKDPNTPASIVQQYKEKESKPEVRPGSIYDTSVYHKAPSVDGKKKSGWLWVLWIVLLLAVGVGAGAVTYFFVLPKL